jgi:hypothetical protein
MTHEHETIGTMPPMVVMKERRNDASAALIHLVDALTQQVHAMNDKLDAHMAAQAVERKTIIEDLIKRAVPEGDLDGHYNYHHAAIEAQRKKAEFWDKMKYELVRWGLIGFIAWAILFFGNAAWLRVLEGPHK